MPGSPIFCIDDYSYFDAANLLDWSVTSVALLARPGLY